MLNKNSHLEAILVNKGYKLTKHRRIILEIFQASDNCWLTAQEVFQKVSDKNKINFVTIYRNLDTLTKLNLLCKIDKGQGISYYTLNNHDYHHHHLICKSCGKTCEINFCPLKEMPVEYFNDFTIIEHNFEIYGYCKECMREIASQH